MDEAPVKPGDMLAGKYRVDRVLGVGGMGVVVAATHVDLQEIRALKFMLPSVADNSVAMERFLREGRAAARIRSEHVAKVHDIGRLESGAPYMVMEYLEGSDLRSLLRRKGPLPVPLVALYAIQVCEALAEAHALGIVHRDLKPANLFLTQRHDGSPCLKVLDFGISKIATSAEADLELTKTHEVLGSPLFMSPEQLQSIRDADARADLWSLGVVLYLLATGRTPFRGDNLANVITAVVTTVPPPPSQHRPEIPAAFDDVVLRCLRRSRDERFQSAAGLAAALRPFVPSSDAAAARLSNPLAASHAGLDAPSAPSLMLVPADVRVASASSASSMLGNITDAPAERTGASWGNTSSQAAPSRRWLWPAISAGILVVGGGALGYRRWSADAEPPSTAGAHATIMTSATSLPTVPSPPVVVPTESDAGAPAPSAAPKPTASAAAPPKTPRRAVPAGDGDGDPFGSSRK